LLDPSIWAKAWLGPDDETRQQPVGGDRPHRDVRGGRLGCQGESGRDGDRRAQRRLGGTNASRDKFPRSILPRAFDYGFATGLIVKDVRLHLDEAKTPGVSTEVADAVARLWEVVIDELGPESDFTAAIKPIERAAGVVVGGKQQN
jgi:hypothetical protein